MSINITCVVCGSFQENAYIVSVEGREDCVVIDPGDEYPKLKRAVGDRRVGAILLTHGHFDHILAAQPMSLESGAPVYIHPLDVEMLEHPELSNFGMAPTSLPAPKGLEALSYGEALSACGMDFKVLHTPGHSKGSVCLYLEDEGVLFSGDTMFRSGYGRMDLHGGSLKQMGKSLKQLCELPVEVKVYPGHGMPTTIGEERMRYHR